MFGLALILALVSLPCTCPASAESRNEVLVARSPDGTGSLIVCGYAEDRGPEAVVASEFQVFGCEGAEVPLISLGATDTARIRTISSGLEIIETSNWPTGEEWKWEPIALYRWTVPFGATEAPQREVILEPPAISSARLAELTGWYDRLLRSSFEVRAHHSEEAVGRVFAAALTGDKTFRARFEAMRKEYGLDGHAAEMYSEAEATLAAVRSDRIRTVKH